MQKPEPGAKMATVMQPNAPHAAADSDPTVIRAALVVISRAFAIGTINLAESVACNLSIGWTYTWPPKSLTRLPLGSLAHLLFTRSAKLSHLAF